MGKLNSVELELILAYIDDVERGEIYKPFQPKEDFGAESKRIIAKLDDLRKEILLLRSSAIENSAKVQQEIANVTHDLKTPLALIMGAVESLEDGMDERDYLGMIKNKAQEMNETVLRIIDSSKGMVASAKKEKHVVDARDLFPSVCAKYHLLATGKKINYVVKKAPKALIAVSEKDILSVMDNLLTNAVKYTEKGKITVSFRASKKHLYVTVKDTGKGIAKEDLPHVFDRFYTEDKARKTGGTGIGLSYVKEAIEAHGGEVYVDSTPGKGSKFTFSLPRVEPKRLNRMSEDKKKCVEASLRLWLFPFFWLVDLYRAIYYGVKESKNKIDYNFKQED
ncbi:MAG: HAMP domain-containing histidine kinase [Clostridia bacterium]|nr:HAMP domain-containing histidine kinase [Clostridia bacterium]